MGGDKSDSIGTLFEKVGNKNADQEYYKLDEESDLRSSEGGARPYPTKCPAPRDNLETLAT